MLTSQRDDRMATLSVQLPSASAPTGQQQQQQLALPLLPPAGQQQGQGQGHAHDPAMQAALALLQQHSQHAQQQEVHMLLQQHQQALQQAAQMAHFGLGQHPPNQQQQLERGPQKQQSTGSMGLTMRADSGRGLSAELQLLAAATESVAAASAGEGSLRSVSVPSRRERGGGEGAEEPPGQQRKLQPAAADGAPTDEELAELHGHLSIPPVSTGSEERAARSGRARQLCRRVWFRQLLPVPAPLCCVPGFGSSAAVQCRCSRACPSPARPASLSLPPAVLQDPKRRCLPST